MCEPTCLPRRGARPALEWRALIRHGLLLGLLASSALATAQLGQKPTLAPRKRFIDRVRSLLDE